MKLLFYINEIHNGGAERVLTNLANQFAERNYEVILVTSIRDAWEYPISPQVKRLNLEEGRPSSNRIKKNLKWLKRLRKYIVDEKPDVAISFMEEANFRMIAACVNLPVRKIVSVRNTPRIIYVNRLYRILAKSLYAFADGIVFQNDDAKSYFPNIIQKKSKIIMNAVKKDFFDASKERSLEENCNIVVAAGRLVPQKNYPCLIRCFGKVVREVPQAKLLIYGQGDLYNDIKEEIIHSHLENNVFLKGQTDDVVGAYRDAGIYVLSSDFEGMPNSLMEAMAAGLACVVTDCLGGGARDLMKDGNEEFLVECNDDAALAEKIILLMRSPEARRKNALFCRKRAQLFQTEINFRQWEAYIHETAGESSAAGKF